MKTITEQELHKSQHLSLDRLKKNLTPNLSILQTIPPRPLESLIDLIAWAKNNFATDQHQAYIHNKIVIDGSFLQFCEEKKVSVKCLLKDSVASWKTEHGFEHFLAQGVFEIKSKGLEFLHCALFHKGNQNEDEVSFFVLLKNEMYEKYISFRNEYEDWLKQRDRNSQEIWVVGGEPIAYEADLTWDDVILPSSLKKEIRESVEGFINNKKFYHDHRLPWKRGMFFWGPPGSGKSLTIKILLSVYGFKPVTIHPGHPNKDELLDEAFEYAQDHGPSLLFLEELPELLASGGIDSSHFLQLLDGVNTKEGLLIIATANDLSKIPANLTDRPSRFDRKILFPLPDQETTVSYLRTLFKKSLTEAQYKKIIPKILKNNFSFAYLKELYVTSAHIAISENRHAPRYEDVERAMVILLKDKSYVQTGFGLSNSKMLDISSFIGDD